MDPIVSRIITTLVQLSFVSLLVWCFREACRMEREDPMVPKKRRREEAEQALATSKRLETEELRKLETKVEA